MISFIFWNITSCSPLKVNQHFGGTCYLHIQCCKVMQTTIQRETESAAISGRLVFVFWETERFISCPVSNSDATISTSSHSLRINIIFLIILLSYFTFCLLRFFSQFAFCLCIFLNFVKICQQHLRFG